MQIKRRIFTAGTMFFLAAATGYMMQNGGTIGNLLFAEDAANTAPVMVVEAPPPTLAPDNMQIDEASVMSLSADTTLPSGGADHPVLPQFPGMNVQPLIGGGALAERMITLEQGFVQKTSDADRVYSSFGVACAATALDVTVAKPAMLMLDLLAPCHPNERLTVSHAGIAVTMKTDMAGHLAAAIPAMTGDGAVSVRFLTGERETAAQAVPDMGTVQRVAILSEGHSAFALNVYENGAAYGAVGHVRAAAPRDAMTAEGGFMVMLGDAALDQPMLAQIYSAPLALKDRRIEVETQVTSDTCGKVRTADAVWTSDGKAMVDKLSLTMPGCDAAGDLIVMDVTPFLASPTRNAAAD
jgi:hypothetical protein